MIFSLICCFFFCFFTLGLFTLGLLHLAGANEASAQAQAAPAPAAETTRDGFLLGASLGLGTLDTGNNASGTLNYHVELGGLVHPKWSLTVGFWGGDDTNEFTNISNNNAGVMTQHWMRDFF